jgi:methylmalonyl-CoA/ethylmalonyl-CoA epimerase
MPGNLKRIGQIALAVSDLQRSLAFWRDTIGLNFLFEAPGIAFFDVAGVRFMLNEDSTLLAPSGVALYFDVADLDAAFTALRDAGVAVAAGGEPHFIAPLGERELWMAFLRDPDGHLFALMSERPAA